MRRLVSGALGLALAGLLGWTAAAPDGLEDRLAGRPLDAHGWARLAWDRHQQGALPRAVAAAVALSMRAAPTDRPLLFARLPLAAAAWDGFTPEDRALALDQAALAWAVDRRKARDAAGPRLLARSLSRAAPPAAGPPPAPAD